MINFPTFLSLTDIAFLCIKCDYSIQKVASDCTGIFGRGRPSDEEHFDF